MSRIIELLSPPKFKYTFRKLFVVQSVYVGGASTNNHLRVHAKSMIIYRQYLIKKVILSGHIGTIQEYE